MKKILIFLAYLLLGIPCEGRIIYVDLDATGGNNGSSWTDAYNYLQDALTDANSTGDVNEIRVAQGVYTPDSNSTIPDGTGDRKATFRLLNGVTINGGYAGFGQLDPDTRDIDQYKTILSGDLDGNDIEIENWEWDTVYRFVVHPSRAENSSHVVTGNGTDATAVLDGFTITCGNAYGPKPGYCDNNDDSLTYGAGMYNDSGSPTVINCTFHTNTTWTIYSHSCPYSTLDLQYQHLDTSYDHPDLFIADTAGAGIYNRNNSMTLRNCTFEENISFGTEAISAGGGIYNVESNTVVINCTFKTNAATGFDSEYWGGAMASYRSDLTLVDCSFTDNLTYDGSGGAMTIGIGNTTLTNCEFSRNSSRYGGAIYGLGQATLTSCKFSENVATHPARGGAIFNTIFRESDKPTLTNCTFNGNIARYGGAIYTMEGSNNLTINNCTFSRNEANSYGGAMYLDYSGPKITNCIISENTAHSGGGLSSWRSNPVISNCVIKGNSAPGEGGGICFWDSNGIISYCEIVGNICDDSEGDGGGIKCWDSNTLIIGCIISGNRAVEGGGGIACGYESFTRIVNCTISGNTTSGYGGGLYSYWSYPEIQNCILYWNQSPIGPQIVLSDWNEFGINTSICTVSYSNIQGGKADVSVFYNSELKWNEGNIDTDPCFVSLGYWNLNETPADANDDIWINGDYHLLPSSSCIDAGDPNYIPEPNETDLDGNPRIKDGRIDVGAYETIRCEARLWIWPRVINRRSHQPRIMAWMRLPQGITKDQVDKDEPLILYPGGVEARHQFVIQSHGRFSRSTYVFAFFNKTELMDAIPGNGRVELQVFGQLKLGQYFYGTDTVRVINPRPRRRWPRFYRR